MAVLDSTDYRVFPSSHNVLLERTALGSPDHKTLGGRAPQGSAEPWRVGQMWNRIWAEMRQGRGCPGSRQARPKEGSRDGGPGVGGLAEGEGAGQGEPCKALAASAAQEPAGTAARSLRPDPQPRPTDVSFSLKDCHGRKRAHHLMSFWSPNCFRPYLPTLQSPAASTF